MTQTLCQICNSLRDFEEVDGVFTCSTCNHSFLRCSAKGCSQLINFSPRKYIKQQDGKEVLCRYCLSQKRSKNPIPNRIKSAAGTAAAIALTVTAIVLKNRKKN